MKSANRFSKGQAYVALRRVKNLEGLYITDFDPKGIKTDDKLNEAMANMLKKKILCVESLDLVSLAKPLWLTIGHLNARYFLEK